MIFAFTMNGPESDRRVDTRPVKSRVFSTLYDRRRVIGAAAAAVLAVSVVPDIRNRDDQSFQIAGQAISATKDSSSADRTIALLPSEKNRTTSSTGSGKEIVPLPTPPSAPEAPHTSMTRIIYPSPLQKNGMPGYYKMPPSRNGSYRFDSDVSSSRKWGSKLLLGVINTVAQRWKETYPQGHLILGDLNAAGHASHKWGRAVDLYATTNGKDCVAEWQQDPKNDLYCNGPYNHAATIELGKMFLDTGRIINIWYTDNPSYPLITDALRTYASKRNPHFEQTGDPDNTKLHKNHFHFDVDSQLLTEWEPK